jgi:multidrug resistance protein MdtO
VVEAATEIGEAQRLARLSVFEPNWLRTRSPVLPEFAALMQGSDIALPEIARLKLLRERPRFLWGAPRSVKAATAAQEANLAGFLNIAAAVMVQPTSDDRTTLNRSLQQAEASLGRLERLSSTKSREAWRRDLLDLIDVYRTLVRAFSRTLEAL